MKKFILIFIIALLLLFILKFTARKHADFVQEPVKTMSRVDLQRYQGQWYEIAAFPTYFSKGCRCSVANYQVKEDYLDVTNSCMKVGHVTEMHAKAYALPESGSAKLNVHFFWLFQGEYWIMYVSPDYRYAIVGSPDRRKLWILARTPQIPHKELQALIIAASWNGFDINRLQFTQQNCN